MSRQQRRIAAHATSPGIDRAKHIVLIAADQRQAVHIQLALLRYGRLVEVARTATRGLRIARNRPPDVIVIAGDFPELDGATLRRMLVMDPATAHIPIFHLLSSDLAPTTRPAGQSGAAALAESLVGHLTRTLPLVDQCRPAAYTTHYPID